MDLNIRVVCNTVLIFDIDANAQLISTSSMVRWISSKTLNFGIGVRSQLNGNCFVLYSIHLFFIWNWCYINKIIISIATNSYLTFLYNFVIYISCIQGLNFFSAVTTKPNFWRTATVNFGKPLLEQCHIRRFLEIMCANATHRLL